MDSSKQGSEGKPSPENGSERGSFARRSSVRPQPDDRTGIREIELGETVELVGGGITEREFSVITDHLPARIAVVDAEERYRFSNRAHRESWGYNLSQILGKPVRDVLGEKNYAEAKPFLESALRGETATFEMSVQYANGSPRYVRVSYIPDHDQSGAIRGCFIIAFDVTDRKLSEEALRQSESRFRRIVEHTRVIPWEADPITGNFVYVGPQATEILGYPVEEWYQERFWEEHLHPEDRERTVALRREAVQNGSDYEFEFRMVSRDGSVLWLQDIVSVVLSYGKPIGFQGFLIDITSAKEADIQKRKLDERLRQFQKMEALGTLAGGIAHDFNNILGGILGYTELALKSIPLGTQPARYLDRVKTSANRARELVGQILSLSKGQPSEKQPVEVVGLLDEVLKLIRATLPANIKIAFNPAGPRATVLANATQLHQVMLNICTNAAYAMKEQGGQLSVNVESIEIDATHIEAYPVLTGGRYAAITVTDTGHGMNESVRERIFEPYFTTKPAGEGSGLGLSVVHGIVAAHGGTIVVDSQLNLGTTFKILIPQIDGSQAANAPALEGLLFGKAQGRVLFVDDEEMLADLGRDMLQQMGYDVVSYTNSAIALKVFNDDPDAFDLVVTDQTMPDVAGDRLVGEVRAKRPDLPIILCTGFSAVIDESRAKQIGVTDFLMKPYSMHQLASAVSRALHHGSGSADQ